MSDSYTIDANIIVTLNRDQPRDIYPSVWQALERLITDGRCVMNREVYEELAKVDDECAPWARSQSGLVQDTTDAELAVVNVITNAHPDWVQETMNAADPFIIAQAAERELIIVTFEKRKGHRGRSTAISKSRMSRVSGMSSASASKSSHEGRDGPSERTGNDLRGICFLIHGVPPAPAWSSRPMVDR